MAKYQLLLFHKDNTFCHKELECTRNNLNKNYKTSTSNVQKFFINTFKGYEMKNLNTDKVKLICNHKL